MAEEQMQDAWFLKSSYPVLFPAHSALSLSRDEFDAFLREELASRSVGAKEEAFHDTFKEDQSMCDAVPSMSISSENPQMLDDNTLGDSDTATTAIGQISGYSDVEHPFVKGLLSVDDQTPENDAPDLSNTMATENGDMAFRSTKDPLVDLFYELEEVVSGPRLMELLDASWACDSLATLKIIFNARSIHLGKSSRAVFYRSAGWLAKKHPLTLVWNIRWLVRPLIAKKVAKNDTSDTVVVEPRHADEADPAHYDVHNGVAHGYWKDLLNILALAANGKLDPLASPRDVLNENGRSVAGVGGASKDAAKLRQRETREKRHEAAIQLFLQDPTYRALHLAIARVFAEQLQLDLAVLNDTNKAAQTQVSLCAKWAPSTNRFHDKHTFVVSSIAEIMHPVSQFGHLAGPEHREAYLRHAREAYRRDLARLRAHLEVVERDISAGTMANINYEHLPSVAMKNYTPLFAKKDQDRFLQYLTKVAMGESTISGATLLPSVLVKAAMSNLYIEEETRKKQTMTKEQAIARVANAQWKTLVQRIRDSGSLENCIAVCDISGSMYSPVFPDGTRPKDAAIGLSLIMSEVARPPFQGVVISFSSTPNVHKVDVSLSLSEKIRRMTMSLGAGTSTNFVAVFEKLILPMAKKHNLKQEDMVKRIFVFSDMQFDEAQDARSRFLRLPRWDTSYSRIERKFQEAGYEMPELVFWNLAGGRAGYNTVAGAGGDPTAPKPVTSDQPGTAMVGGYSPAMMKVFMDGNSFDELVDDEEVVVRDVEEDPSLVDVYATARLGTSRLVAKAISHKAYDMLRVMD